MRKGFFARLAVQNIRKNRKIYYPYILTVVMTITMLYIITSLSRNPGLQDANILFSLQLGSVVTTLFSLIFLFYTNSFLMKRRKKEFGLYNILGMEKKHIGRVVGWETLIILAFSLIVGFGVGILMDKLMYMLVMRLMGVTAEMQFYVSTYSLGYTALIITGTFVLIYLNSLRQIHLAKPIELLKGGQVGEREPKAHWILAVLGVLTLGGGYFLSIAVTNVIASIFIFFLAVVLVIIGTYLLFTTGSISLLKIMRKNKKYYYRADHFINVSGMIYRMKQNAVGLANICILSTMVLVMVFSTVALRVGIDDMTNSRCPNDLTVEGWDAEQRNEQMPEELQAIVYRQIEAAGLERKPEREQLYYYLSFAGLKKDAEFLTDPDQEQLSLFGDGLNYLFIVTLQDYNRQFGTSETLAPDEVLTCGTITQYDQPTLSVFGKTFRVKALAPKMLLNGSVIASIYNTQMVVVDSWQTLDWFNQRQHAVYGKYASDVRLYMGVDVTGTHDEHLALMKSIYAACREVKSFELRATESKASLFDEFKVLYAGLFFIGLFLGTMFTMAMILIVYYKQISEGYDDQERYRIMRKVGLSLAETKKSINSQIVTVFFLPLITAGVHIAFAFPSLSRMFLALGLGNVKLELICAVASFVAFAVLYGIVYTLTAKVYYKIVSAR